MYFKNKRKPFLPPENKSKEPFEPIYMDKGVAYDESIYENKYFGRSYKIWLSVLKLQLN